MADALLGVAFQNLMSLLQNEFPTMFGIRSKAQKLSNTLDLIKVVLEDAEKKQLTDRSVRYGYNNSKMLHMCSMIFSMSVQLNPIGLRAHLLSNQRISFSAITLEPG
ncbi:hypothetical protein P8452_43758 [Trifolium repens]|nr:hypothetical protein P8452_43758 [Trifolium repens]